jgi:hypothetical protein
LWERRERQLEKGSLMKSHLQRCARPLAIILAMTTIALPAAKAGRYGPGTPSPVGQPGFVEYPRAICHQYCAWVDERASDRTLIHHSDLVSAAWSSASR